MNELLWTGERLVTSLNNTHGVIEHLHRYALAMDLASDKKVLDIASGEGYGSYLLSKSASYVYGVDIDENAVMHARSKYKDVSNLEYYVGSASDIPIEDSSIDVVISFETIEHHDKHDQMMLEINRVLKPNGILLISSPEKSIYSERDPDNMYHIKELTFDEFKNLLCRYFFKVELFVQRFVVASLIHRIDTETPSPFQMYDGDFNQIEKRLRPDKIYNNPYFNLALCYKSEYAGEPKLNNSIFNGVSVVNNKIEELYERLQKTTTSSKYMLGNWLLKIFPFLRYFVQALIKKRMSIKKK